MLHQRRPHTCWCGTRHTASETFDLNVHGREFPPEPADVQLEEIRAAEVRHQRVVNIASAGGWHLLTNDEVDQLIAASALSECTAHRLPFSECPDCTVTVRVDTGVADSSVAALRKLLDHLDRKTGQPE